MIAVDTTVAIDFLRGKEYAVSALDSLVSSNEAVGLSAVSAFELLHPIYHRKMVRQGRIVRSFLNQTKLLPLDEDAAEEAANVMGSLLRIGEETNPLDALIAGTALAGGAARLLSADSDFQRIARVSELNVEIVGEEPLRGP